MLFLTIKIKFNQKSIAINIICTYRKTRVLKTGVFRYYLKFLLIETFDTFDFLTLYLEVVRLVYFFVIFCMLFYKKKINFF